MVWLKYSRKKAAAIRRPWWQCHFEVTVESALYDSVHQGSALDMLRVLFFVLDITFVPYLLSFDIDLKASIFFYFLLVAFVFWSLDLVVNFFTGYVQAGGGVVMRWRSIAIMYLRTYFLIDLVVVVADGMNIAFVVHPEEQLSSGFAWQSIRILRFVKLARVLRVVISMNSGGLFSGQV